MSEVEPRWTERELAFSRALHRAVDDASPASPPPTATRPVTAPVDLGRRRRWALAAVPALAACVVTALVVGIGLATRDAPAPAAGSPDTPPVQDVGALQGSWDVELPDPRADDEDLRLALSGRGGTISQAGCGATLTWGAHSDGLFLADARATYGVGSCDGPAQQGWIEDAEGFVVRDPSRVELVSRGGGLVASLVRAEGTARPVGPQDGVVPLAEGLDAPTSAQLEGRWVRIGEPKHWFTFADERWATSPDGCNTSSGAFVLSPLGGVLRSQVLTTTLAECGDMLPAWPVVGIERLGLDGNALVLLDAHGTVLLRMERAGASGGQPLLDRVQGEWLSVGSGTLAQPSGLWLRIDGAQLTHAHNASCNTDANTYRLSVDGAVTSSQAGSFSGCQPGFPALVPRPIARVDLDGEQLVALDEQDEEIARFVRATP